jgi:hypothetical protein
LVVNGRQNREAHGKRVQKAAAANKSRNLDKGGLGVLGAGYMVLVQGKEREFDSGTKPRRSRDWIRVRA